MVSGFRHAWVNVLMKGRNVKFGEDLRPVGAVPGIAAGVMEIG
jgi:hypothetical protein